MPENTLKFSVGVLLASFGAFWMGEGLGLHWPGGDLAILGLAGAFLTISLLTSVVLRRAPVDISEGGAFRQHDVEGAETPRSEHGEVTS